MVGTLITILLGVFPLFLKGIPGISATIQQIIADITASVAALIGSGVVTQPTFNTAMAAWAGVITALENDPNLPKTSLQQVLELKKIIQAVQVQDAKLAQAIDWTQLNPITPVP